MNTPLKVLATALCGSALLFALTSPASAKRVDPHVKACHAAAELSMDAEDVAAVCKHATPYSADCIELALSHGLAGEQVTLACHEAEPWTLSCIESAWDDGLRGQSLAIGCYLRELRQGPPPTTDVFLYPAGGVETASLPKCGGHIDVSRDEFGALTVLFSTVQSCATFEVFGVEPDRRFTSRVDVGDGPMRRTGSWEVPTRISRAAEGGLRFMLRDANGNVRDQVWVSFVADPAPASARKSEDDKPSRG